MGFLFKRNSELTSKYDSILRGGAPGLHEVNSVTTAQWGVPSEDHTRRLIDHSQLTVNVGELLKTTTLDELEQDRYRRSSAANQYRHTHIGCILECSPIKLLQLFKSRTIHCPHMVFFSGNLLTKTWLLHPTHTHTHTHTHLCMRKWMFWQVHFRLLTITQPEGKEGDSWTTREGSACCKEWRAYHSA